MGITVLVIGDIQMGNLLAVRSVGGSCGSLSLQIVVVQDIITQILRADFSVPLPVETVYILPAGVIRKGLIPDGRERPSAPPEGMRPRFC